MSLSSTLYQIRRNVTGELPTAGGRQSRLATLEQSGALLRMLERRGGREYSAGRGAATTASARCGDTIVEQGDEEVDGGADGGAGAGRGDTSDRARCGAAVEHTPRGGAGALGGDGAGRGETSDTGRCGEVGTTVENTPRGGGGAGLVATRGARCEAVEQGDTGTIGEHTPARGGKGAARCGGGDTGTTVEQTPRCGLGARATTVEQTPLGGANGARLSLCLLFAAADRRAAKACALARDTRNSFSAALRARSLCSNAISRSRALCSRCASCAASYGGGASRGCSESGSTGPASWCKYTRGDSGALLERLLCVLCVLASESVNESSDTTLTGDAGLESESQPEPPPEPPEPPELEE